MKKNHTVVVSLLLVSLFYCCKHEEKVSPTLGNATFSLSLKTKSGGRTAETATPAFVLLSLKDGNDKAVQNSKKLPLFPFGQSYLSENLSLQTGTYLLTEFAVLDASNKVIYATPLDGSDLAKYVADPLPISFTISENTTIQVVPQVLAITSEDAPESFGLASFGFEVIERITQLHTEEIFLYDPASSTSTDGFVGLLKKKYTYEQDKLVQIDLYEYNPTTNSYDPGYKYEEYHYNSKGKLAQKIKFTPNGIKWIHEYEYLSDESTKVTQQEYYNDAPIGQPDWWIMEHGPSSLTVKYYQRNNELFLELNYEMDGKGNVISQARTPSAAVGKLYFKYDNSPNPYRFPVLGGEFGTDPEKYLSQNNVVGQADHPNPESTRIIEYNKEGYPVIIITQSSKRVLTY
jgi:hypothetical protein